MERLESARGNPRLGGLSLTETEERRNTVRKEGAARASATKARRKHKAGSGAVSLRLAGSDDIMGCLWYNYHDLWNKNLDTAYTHTDTLIQDT